VLGCPFDVAVARKLGVPGIEEVALGAIAEGSRRVVGDPVGWYIGVPRRVVSRIAVRERAEVERRADLYRGGRAIPDLQGRTVVLVDDGLATGATLHAAPLALRDRRPARLLVAVPVASAESAAALRAEVDDLVSLVTPESFGTVSDWYEDFSPVADADVMRLLGREQGVPVGRPTALGLNAHGERPVTVPADGCSLAGDLGLPDDLADGAAPCPLTVPRGVVVLAHGGGSSRHSYRNRYLAGRLRLAGFATLRLDLLTDAEPAADTVSAEIRFDVTHNAERLIAASE
jgi:putative phosphoribosyl transferase